MSTKTKEFLEAAENGNTNRLSDLLREGVDPNVLDDEGNTALICAGMNGRTVNLVSHVHGFFPGGRLVEINTSLESSWSPILISVGFDLNRGQLDELQ